MSPYEQAAQAAQVAAASAGSGPEALIHWLFGLVMSGLGIGARYIYNKVNSQDVRISALELEAREHRTMISERHSENLRRFDSAEETIENGFARLENLIRNNAPRR